MPRALSDPIRTIRRNTGACLLGVAAHCATVAHGADVPWITPGDGDYLIGVNWLGGAVPMSANRAVFSLPIAHTVWLSGPTQTGSLLIASGDVTLDLNGAPLAFTNAANTVVVENTTASNPTLRLRDGLLTAATTDVALSDNASGALEIGPGGVWRTSLDTRIAYGPGSSGELHVHGGGTLEVLRDLFIGFHNGAYGAALVEGADSLAQVTREINVGMDTEGMLHVRDGGRVTAKDIYLARSSRADAEFVVDGPASSAAFVFKLSVGAGFRADADLRIDNGASVYSYFGVLGEIQESEGAARIANGAHWEIENAFYIGFRAAGSLDLDSGATVNSKFTSVGRYSGSSGHARVRGEGTRWNNLLHINVGVDANTSGALIVENGATVESETVVIGPNGSLAGDGVVEALVTNNGVVEAGTPGEEPDAPSGVGALTIRGGYTQTPDGSGVLRLQIGGFTPGAAHDTLLVDGQATLGGALHVEFIDGFSPPIGAVFPLISATSINGAFDAATLPTFTDGRFCVLFTNGSTLFMTVLRGVLPPRPTPIPPTFFVDFDEPLGVSTDTDPTTDAASVRCSLTPNAMRTLIYAVLNTHAE